MITMAGCGMRLYLVTTNLFLAEERVRRAAGGVLA
jgi:hypothetical protein